MYNLVLFDLDGTLTDSKEGIINCVKYALESFGISENDEKILNSFIGPPLYDSFRREYGFSHSDALLAVKKYRERFGKTGIFENTIYDDTVTALTMLKNGGKKLALATSKPYVYAERILKYVRGKKNTMGSSNIETLYRLSDNHVEAIEMVIKKESAVIGKQLKDIPWKPGVIIGCINHKGSTSIANGNSVIKDGDTVILFTTTTGMKNIEDGIR